MSIAISRRAFVRHALAAGAAAPFAALGGCAAAGSRGPFDLLLRGGAVVDGTGAPRRLADV
ncbi:MAG: hypothetical protein ACK5BN_15660, partial [Planctomycetota bacterium]